MIPEHILHTYPIGSIRLIRPIVSGLMHSTFLIESDRGRFILQKLHPLLASQDIADDFLTVTEFLRSQQFPSTACVKTISGDVLARDGEVTWRMQAALEGVSHDRIDDLAMIAEAGHMLGQFHQTIAKLDNPLRSTFVLPPNPQVVYDKFLDVVAKARQLTPVLIEDVCEQIDFINSHYPQLFLPTDLPQRIVHGDPKISNFLFNEDRCVGLIDLDTCNKQSILMELGDAFRSWCGGVEDDPQNTFSREKFEAGWNGYRAGAGELLNTHERSLVPQAIQLLTLELACRFLTDYFEDSYFGWDEKRYQSRRDHNKTRCRGQIAEYESIVLNDPVDTLVS